MSIYLGDLTISQMEKRSGVEFPSELKEHMEKNHQSTAENIQKGKWHCFDMPYMLICGDMETAQKIYNHLKDLTFETPLEIGVQK